MFLANIVRFIHILLLLFVLIVPFTNNFELLILHFIIVPGIVFHWYMNSNVCCLTMTEQILRGKKNTDETLTGSILNPIFNLSKHDESTLIFYVTLSLWLITVYKLYNNPKFYQFWRTMWEKIKSIF